MIAATGCCMVYLREISGEYLIDAPPGAGKVAVSFPAVLASIDETTPDGAGGVYYVVAAAMFISDPEDARNTLAGVVGKRKRPFHWHLGGSTVRTAMVKCLEDLGAVAHVCIHYPTGRRKQEAARSLALTELLPLLIHDGVEELLIEQRGELEDARDRRTVVGVLKDLDHRGLVYDWRDKGEPLIWPADAVCGAVREWVLRQNSSYYDTLVSAGVLSEPRYIAPPELRKSRLPS